MATVGIGIQSALENIMFICLIRLKFPCISVTILLSENPPQYWSENAGNYVEIFQLMIWWSEAPDWLMLQNTFQICWKYSSYWYVVSHKYNNGTGKETQWRGDKQDETKSRDREDAVTKMHQIHLKQVQAMWKTIINDEKQVMQGRRPNNRTRNYISYSPCLWPGLWSVLRVWVIAVCIGNPNYLQFVL